MHPVGIAVVAFIAGFGLGITYAYARVREYLRFKARAEAKEGDAK